MASDGTHCIYHPSRLFLTEKHLVHYDAQTRNRTLSSLLPLAFSQVIVSGKLSFSLHETLSHRASSSQLITAPHCSAVKCALLRLHCLFWFELECPLYVHAFQNLGR